MILKRRFFGNTLKYVKPFVREEEFLARMQPKIMSFVCPIKQNIFLVIPKIDYLQPNTLSSPNSYFAKEFTRLTQRTNVQKSFDTSNWFDVIKYSFGIKLKLSLNTYHDKLYPSSKQVRQMDYLVEFNRVHDRAILFRNHSRLC